MKFKAALHYQLVELLQSALAFCAIVGAVIVVVSIFAGSPWFQTSIVNFIAIVLIFLLPLNMFSGDITFLLHMGLSRMQVYASSALAFAALALFLALVEVVCAGVFGRVLMGSSSFAGSLYGLQNLGVLVDFAWMFGANLAVALTALTLAIAQVKVGTKWLLAGLVVVAALVFAVIPAICEALFGVSLPMAEGAAGLFGIAAAGMDPTRVLPLFAGVVVVAALMGCVLVRRIEVRA